MAGVMDCVPITIGPSIVRRKVNREAGGGGEQVI
jgi:hypothetical protein